MKRSLANMMNDVEPTNPQPAQASYSNTAKAGHAAPAPSNAEEISLEELLTLTNSISAPRHAPPPQRVPSAPVHAEQQSIPHTPAQPDKPTQRQTAPQQFVSCAPAQPQATSEQTGLQTMLPQQQNTPDRMQKMLNELRTSQVQSSSLPEALKHKRQRTLQTRRINADGLLEAFFIIFTVAMVVLIIFNWATVSASIVRVILILLDQLFGLLIIAFIIALIFYLLRRRR